MRRTLNLGYGGTPKKCDRAKLYLYLKGWVKRFFKFRCARNGDGVIRTILLASMSNSYVEGSASLLNLCGQTARNHLKYQDPFRFATVNQEVIDRMRALGALSKPSIIAVDWHDETYYGDPGAEGVLGTQSRKGSHHAHRFATASVLADGERVALAVVPMSDPDSRSILGHVKRLLGSVSALWVRVKLILFDRGCYSAELLRYLDSVEAR